MRKITSLFFTLLLSWQTFAFEFDIQPLKNYLTNIGTVESTYHYICDRKFTQEDPELEQHWLQMCQVVVASDLCQQVDEEDRLKCLSENYHENEVDYSSTSFVFRCLFGAGKSVINFLSLIKDILWSTIKYTFSSEFRELKNSEVSDLVDSITSYVTLEYVKELDKGHSKAEAQTRVAGSIIQKIFGDISASLAKNFQELGCYHQKARQIKVCEKMGDIVLPTAAALKLIAKSFGLFKKITPEGPKPFKPGELRGATGIRYNRVSQLRSKFKNEENGVYFGTKVEYLKGRDRDAREVFVGEGGRLYDVTGDPIDTSFARNSSGGMGKAIFVMSPDGRIFYSNSQVTGQFHHSSFLAGGPVAAAGEIAVQDGYLLYVNRKSGHYFPDKENTSQFLDELKHRGAADIDDVEVSNLAHRE